MYKIITILQVLFMLVLSMVSLNNIAIGQNREVENILFNGSMGWITKDNLSPRQISAMSNSSCSGAYYLDVMPFEHNPNEQDQLKVLADNVSSSTRNNSLNLRGNVSLYQNSINENEIFWLKADEISIDESSQDFKGNNVILARNSLMLSSPRLEANNTKFNLNAEDIYFVAPDTNLRASSDSIYSENYNESIFFNSTRISFCEPDSRLVSIGASSLEADVENGIGYITNGILYLYDVPVFYWPWLNFPLYGQRLTGFLFPIIQYRSINGWNTTAPFYWNIAPNFDMTFFPRYIDEAGTIVEVETRLQTANTYNIINTSYLPSDNRDNKEYSLVDVYNRGSYGDFRSHIEYTYVNDELFFDRIGTELNTNNDLFPLYQRAEVSYNIDNLRARVRVLDLEQKESIVSSSVYTLLPEVSLNLYPQQNNYFSYSLDTVYSQFQRLQRGNAETVDRINGNVNIEVPILNLYSISSHMGAVGRFRYYEFDEYTQIEEDVKSYDDYIYSTWFDLSSTHYIDYSSNVYQSISPKLYFLYTPVNVEQNDLPEIDTSYEYFSYNTLLSKNRFTGEDRYGDTLQTSAIIETSLFNNQYNELINLGAGQIFYFKDREVLLNPNDDEEVFFSTSEYSPTAVRLEGFYSRVHKVSTETHLYRGENIYNNLVYTFRGGRYLSLAQLSIVERKEFTDTENQNLIRATSQRFGLRIGSNWRFSSFTEYNLDKERLEESRTSISYIGCCMSLGLSARTYLNNDVPPLRLNSYSINVSLANIGQLTTTTDYLDELESE